MAQFDIEDVMILLDTSRSMARGDFSPSRLAVALRGLSALIPKKFEIDPNDRIGIVTFGTKAIKIHDLSSSGESLVSCLEKIEFGGRSDISDGLALSIQILGNEIRKIGGKIVRIILLSDDRLGKMTNRLIKLANAAKGLGIFIDSLVTAPPSTRISFSVLKNLSLITGGDFAYFKNERAFHNAAIGLASKKDLNDISGYWEAQERGMHSAPLLAEIAVELRRPNIGEIQEMIANPTKVKCNICYKSSCPVCHGPPYATIRYCPSCDRAMHMDCARGWAKNSPNTTGDIFRCPFCYFLLRLPPDIKEISRAASTKDKNGGSTNFAKVPRDAIPSIPGSCGNCHHVFMGEQDVYQCNSCGTYFHESCLKEIYKRYGACRTCGKTIANYDALFS